MLAVQYNRVGVCKFLLCDYEGGKYADGLIRQTDCYGNDIGKLATKYGSIGVLRLLKDKFPAFAKAHGITAGGPPVTTNAAPATAASAEDGNN